MIAGRLNIVQGEYAVSAKPDVHITTILGSCIATCIHDGEAGIGGMNHFLLPGDTGSNSLNARYGVHLMELLINGLMRAGASRDRLQAKIFGGARTVRGLADDIGKRNIAFAKEFLGREGIPLIGESTGGNAGRRIQYWPSNGRVRQMFIAEAPVQKPILPTLNTGTSNAGDVDLF